MGTPSITELGELVIPEKATLEEMVRSGEYDGYKPSIDAICQHFPITRRGPRTLYLVHFKKKMNTEEVEQAVAAMGMYELAKVEDLLAVGAHPKHKELQRRFPVICTGSFAVLNGQPCVPCLFGWDVERRLSLAWYDHRWDDTCRFLLVGKQ